MKIVKIVIGALFTLLGLKTMFTDSFLGGLLILIAGLLLLPPIEQKLKSQFKIFNKKIVYIAAVLIPFAIGSGLGRVAEETRIEKNTVSNKQVIEYIQTSTNDKSINNIKKLLETGKLFNEESYALERTDKHLQLINDSINNKMYFVFIPVVDYKMKVYQDEFLSDIPNKGKLENYIVKFEIDSIGSILSKDTEIKYTTGKIEALLNNDVPDFKTFINTDIVSKQEKIVAEQKMVKEANALVQKQKEEYNKRAEKFEEDCFNPWNGSHTLFARYVKERLNDPESFEHVTTTYKLYDGFAIINMTFRGKNAFNATVTNKMSAKVSLEDCSIIEVIE